MTFAIQKTTKSGVVTIIMRGLDKERAERLAVASAYADFDGSKYEAVAE